MIDRILMLLLRLTDPGYIGGFAFLIIILGGMAIFLWRDRGALSRIILVYFLICACIIFASHYRKMNPYSSYMDVYNFNESAQNIAAMIKTNPLTFLAHVDFEPKQYYNPAYVIILGLLYALFANSLVVGELFSALCGCLVLYHLYNFTKNIYDKKTAIYTTFLLAVSPFYIYISTRLLRETLCMLVILIFLRLWQNNQQKRAKINIVYMGFCLVYIAMLRMHFAALLLLVLMISIVGSMLVKKFGFKGVVVAAAVIMLGALVIINEKPDVFNNILLKGFKQAEIERLESREATSAEIKFAYAENIKISGFSDLFLLVPKMAFYFMTVPLPWQCTELKLMVLMIDSGVLWIIYFIALFELIPFWRSNRKWAIILYSYLFIGICGAGLIQANVTSAMRHRLPFTMLILPFAAHRLSLRWGKKRVTSQAKEGGQLKPQAHWPARQPLPGTWGEKGLPSPLSPPASVPLDH